MSASRTPRFSVLIPLYNHAPYIEATIQSVLDQTHPAAEIIVIDDGSTDGGLDIVRRVLKDRPGAVIKSQPNAGAHVTLNRCVEASSGEFLAVLNSDDLFRPGKLARCAEIFAAHDEVDLLFGGVQIIDGQNQIIKDGPVIEWLLRARNFLSDSKLPLLSLLNENYCVTTSNMVFSRNLWKKNKGFQPLRYCHDLDFIAASFRNGIVHSDSGFDHISYRVHATNTIKETLSKVRVEIAAVLTSAILENRSGLMLGNTTAPNVKAFLDVLRTKNVSDLSLVMATSYASYPDRTSFYDAVVSSPLSEIYQAAVVDPTPSAEIMPSKPVPAAITPAAAKGPPIGLVIEVSSFDKGGLEKVVLDTAVLFREKGFAPLIVSAGPVGHLGRIAATRNIEVVRLPTAGRHAFYRSLLRVRNIKLSMSHFSRTGYEVFAELGIPNITFIHNVYAFLTGEALANFQSDDRFVQSYVSVSHNATRYATGRLGIEASKILTVPNGLIFEEHEERASKADPISRAILNIADTDYVFLNVASYNLHKAHYLMTNAMEIILRNRRDIKILCVGNDIHPPHVKQLRDHIAARGLEDHVLMPGYFAEVAALHAMSDAFLLPSFIEGWSIAMNEAMFYGKPMILSDTGGSADVIEGEDIGILLPNEYGDILNLDAKLLDELAYTPREYRTAPLLASAMARFADAPDRWRKAGQRGREKALARYAFSDAVDRYVVEMRRLLGRTQ